MGWVEESGWDEESGERLGSSVLGKLRFGGLALVC